MGFTEQRRKLLSFFLSRNLLRHPRMWDLGIKVACVLRSCLAEFVCLVCQIVLRRPQMFWER